MGLVQIKTNGRQYSREDKDTNYDAYSNWR